MVRYATPTDLWRISLPRNLRPDDPAFLCGSISDVARSTNQGAGTVAVAGAPYDAYAVQVRVAQDGNLTPQIGAVTIARKSTSTAQLYLEGVPLVSAKVRIEVLATGGLGTARFRYSLDDGATYSLDLLVPAAPGKLVLQGTGVTVTFVPWDGPLILEAGDVFTFPLVPVAKVRFLVYHLAGAQVRGTGSVVPTGWAVGPAALLVRIATAGIAGAATFEYSLNGGGSWSAPAVVPLAGVPAVLGATGISLLFDAGLGVVPFAAGDCWSIVTTGQSALRAVSPDPVPLRDGKMDTGLALVFGAEGATSPLFVTGEVYSFATTADPDMVEALDIASDEADGLLADRYEQALSKWGPAIKRYVCDMARLIVLSRRGLNVGEDQKSHGAADKHARAELEAIASKLRNHPSLEAAGSPKILAPACYPSADPFEIGDGIDGMGA